ncbi:MAG: leucine-rich repeat protein [Paludibacteraceae bacterium]|nr:leucine-rich repeat protein [Paludibacteraceae bacterium]
MKKKILSFLAVICCSTGVLAGNTISYTASEPLPTASDSYESGLHTSAFDVGIQSHTFANEHGLITFSDDLTSVGTDAFKGCTNLTSITLPNSITTIGVCAFAGCSSLTSIAIPDSVTLIGLMAFNGCSSLSEVIIPNSVTMIGTKAFLGCSSLKSIDLPNSVTEIGEWAFYGCEFDEPVYNSTYFVYFPRAYNWLHAYTIPSGIKKISDYAFANSMFIDTVTIPRSVVEIGENAFLDGKVNTLYCYAPEPPVCGTSSFAGLYPLDVYVRYESLSAYRGAPVWGGIVGISTLPTLTVESGSPEHGTVYGTGDYYWEDSCVLTVVPDYKYRFVKWNDGNTDNPRVLAVTQDTLLTAELEQYFYTCKAEANDTLMGLVSGGIDSCDYMTAVELNAIAYHGYHFTGWSDGSSDNPYMFPLAQDTSLTAYFAKNSYTVAAPTVPNMSVDGAGVYTYLDTCTLTVVPDRGYHFVKWSDGNTDNPRVLTVTQDSTLTAEVAIDVYSCAVESGDTVMGYVTGQNDDYDYMTEVEMSATAHYGYHFVEWSDGVSENPYRFMLTQDTSLTAIFAKNIYTVGTSPESHLTIMGVGAYAYLDTCMLIVIPDYGYHFTAWSDGNTDNPRVLTVTQDTMFTAEWAQYIYTCTAEPNDSLMGYVVGDGTYEAGSQVSIIAIANGGYEFVEWSNGVKDNPYRFTLTEDVELTAVFKEVEASTAETRSDSLPVKYIRNGQLYIRRNGKVYTLQGQAAE